MKLFVVVLCYKVPDLTIDCLRSLEPEIRRTPGIRVGVCENGTGADAADRLAAAIEENGWGSWCDLTVTHPNLGFCAGNNLLIRPELDSDDPPEYVLLLNADTLVREGALAALIDFMDGHPRAGIAGSRLISPDGSDQGSPFRFQGIRSELDRGMKLGLATRLMGTGPLPKSPEPTRVDWVAGASMILRTEMLRQVGVLDDGLYTYFDDIDLCLRAKRAGWETWQVPGSVVVHLEGASTGISHDVAVVTKRRPAYWFEARRRFFLKNHGGLYTAMADAALLLGLVAWRIRNSIQRKPDTDPRHLLSDSWRHSVFRTGFELKDVENPALKSEATAAASR
ncbi:glycosyltransferase family 2 protein [Aquisphaera insulae]|uniref:glycosyltransferase family 2 protein n=1 Tax=Aquisphaera insulae TaxID=2712864 RepID=UPI0013EB9098|nr:glycosyltransferase family 2 protein [Aquisphaera insulae]